MNIDEKSDYDRRIELLIRRLPERWQNLTRRIRSGQARWWRITIGTLLYLSAFFWFLPILGLWMLPLGIILLAEDIPFIRRLNNRALAWVEAKHPRWLDLPRTSP
jgi:hypothetical protein